MSILLHPHVTCVWGDFLIGLGMGVRAFKPLYEAFQAVGECTNHLHHVHHFEITVLISWWFTNPISSIISRSSWLLRSCTILCSQLLTIWSSMPLKSAMMTHTIWSRTSLWSWMRLGSGFRPAHRLITWIQQPFVPHISLLLYLGLLSSKTNISWFFAFINFTSLVTFLDELLPSVYPNLDLSEKLF